MYVTNEIKIMEKIDHPNIVKLLDFYEGYDNFYIVMELMQGGELFDRIVEKENFTE